VELALRSRGVRASAAWRSRFDRVAFALRSRGVRASVALWFGAFGVNGEIVFGVVVGFGDSFGCHGVQLRVACGFRDFKGLRGVEAWGIHLGACRGSNGTGRVKDCFFAVLSLLFGSYWECFASKTV
jgi:hypothetical protein